jgi:hypothetical protein
MTIASFKAFYEPDAKDGLEGQEIDGVAEGSLMKKRFKEKL